MTSERQMWPNNKTNPDPVKVPEVSGPLEFQYPSDYWKDHQGQKPVVNIMDLTPEESYHQMNHNLPNDIWTDESLCTFLYNSLVELKENWEWALDNDWVANGVVIGKKGDKISPLNLLDFQKTVEKPKLPEVIVSSDQIVRKSLYAGLLTIYRKGLAKSISSSYRTTIDTKVNSYFRTTKYGMLESEISRVHNFATETRFTPGFKKIICAIDMFFAKRPNCDWSGCRIATLSCRYRGCTTLTLLAMVSANLGLEPGDLGVFAFTDFIGKDFYRITKETSVDTDKDSYFPYHLEMGFVTKSAYSTIANPTLTFWLHVMGIVKGLPRCYNARLPNTLDADNTFNCAVAVAFGVAGAGGLDRQFFASQAAQQARFQFDEQEQKAREQAKERQIRSPEETEDDVAEDIPGEEAPVNRATNPSGWLENKANKILNDLIKFDGLSLEWRDKAAFMFRGLGSCHLGTMGKQMYTTRSNPGGPIGN